MRGHLLHDLTSVWRQLGHQLTAGMGMWTAVDQPNAHQPVDHPTGGRRTHTQPTGQRGQIDLTPMDKITNVRNCEIVSVSSTNAIDRADTATSNRDAVNSASVITSTDSAVALSTVIVPRLLASG